MWWENILDKLSVFLNLLRLVCGLACDLSWRMFEVHLKRKCILLLSGGMLYKYQSSQFGLLLEVYVFLLIFYLDDPSTDVLVSVPEGRVEVLCVCRCWPRSYLIWTLSYLKGLQPAMGTSTPHVHGGCDSGTCLELRE